MVLTSATIEGQPAEIETLIDTEEERYWVHLQKKGMHIVDVELQVPLKLQGESGQFSVNLLPASSGLMSIKLPRKEFQVSVAGSYLPHREVDEDNGLLIEQPISMGGDLEFKWQPKSNREDTSSIVHAESLIDIHLNESGAKLTSRSTLNVRRGSLNQIQFALPEGIKVREIKGADVGGWSLQEEEGQQQLQILFRRTIDKSTNLEVELYQPVISGMSENKLVIDRLGPQNLNRSVGTVAIHAPQHLSLKTNKVENLIQINPSDLPGEHHQSSDQKLAFRYHKVPFTLDLSVWQKKTTTEAIIKHAVVCRTPNDSILEQV
ncbi:MAG: hypothetical protein R3C11_08150 [Planctomycetaceae bacterium]